MTELLRFGHIIYLDNMKAMFELAESNDVKTRSPGQVFNNICIPEKATF